MKRLNKIGFIIHMPREIDFYVAVWETMPAEKFDIIIDDYTASVHLDRILNILINMKLGYVYLSEIIKNKINYKAVLATKDFQMRYRAFKPKGFNAKRDLAYRQSLDWKTTLSRKLINLGLQQVIKRILGKPKFGDRIYREWNFNNPDMLSDRRILFPRGIDLDDHEPEFCNAAYFTEFFCHGLFDSRLYESAFRLQTSIIGYPRYDYQISAPDTVKKASVSDTSPVKVLWMGSMHASGLELWLPSILTISRMVEFTYRPHPKSVARDTEKIAYLKKHDVNVNINENENLLNLYQQHDVVIAEWGDSIFSSIYNGKITILAEIPEYGDPPDRHGLYDLVSETIPTYSTRSNGSEKLINQIMTLKEHSDIVLDNQIYLKLRKKLFGEISNKQSFKQRILSYLD